jgi:hypothetical protein
MTTSANTSELDTSTQMATWQVPPAGPPTGQRWRLKALSGAILGVSLLMPALAAATPAVAATTATGSSTGASHHQTAVSVARRLLADVSVPPGAQVSTSRPKGSGPLLSRPAQLPASPNLIDDKVFYVTEGHAPIVLKWFESHPPTGSTLAGTGTLSTGGHPNLWSADFSWPGVHNVMFSEDVIVGVVQLSGRRTGVRIDSQVTWLPGRSPLDTVPGGARQVTVIVAVPNADGSPGKHLEPVISTTDTATVAQVRKDVNSLQVLLPGIYPCPPGPDLDIYVEFAHHPSTAPFAVTTAYPYGCAFVNMAVHGQASPQILVDGGVLAHQLKELVGMKLPPVPPGGHEG